MHGRILRMNQEEVARTGRPNWLHDAADAYVQPNVPKPAPPPTPAPVAKQAAQDPPLLPLTAKALAIPAPAAPPPAPTSNAASSKAAPAAGGAAKSAPAAPKQTPAPPVFGPEPPPPPQVPKAGGHRNIHGDWVPNGLPTPDGSIIITHHGECWHSVDVCPSLFEGGIPRRTITKWACSVCVPNAPTTILQRRARLG